jgi:hypothetical protein
MPELPDVEGFRRVLMSHSVGLPIEHVDVQDEGLLHDVTAGQLQDKLRGRRFDEPRRHGKWLIVPVGKGSMLLPGANASRRERRTLEGSRKPPSASAKIGPVRRRGAPVRGL